MPHPQANQKSALGMDANVAAMLGYLVGVFAIVNLVAEKDNNFVRFHAVQHIFFSLSIAILYIVLIVVLFILQIVVFAVAGIAASAAGDAGGIIGIILWIITMLLWIALPLLFIAMLFGGIIFSAIKAYQGEAFKLPLIGRLAAKVIPV